MNKYRVLQKWDDDYAGYRYHLQLLGETGVYLNTGSDGDQEWAKRQAEHYHCDIEVTDPIEFQKGEVPT